MQYCNLSCKIFLPASGAASMEWGGGEYSHYSEMIVLDRAALDKSQLSNNFKYTENSEHSVKQLSQKDYSL